MNLQGNGNNHNHRPNLNSENDSFLKFNDSAQYEKITGQAPAAIETDGTVEFGSEEERKRKLQEAMEKENSSAYDDLDDFIYKQNKRRARTSGRRHHHRHISPSVLSPGRVRKMKSDKKPHKHRHHYRKHHHKRMKRWQKVSLGIIITLLSIIIIGIVFIFLMYNSGKNALLDKSGIDINVPNIAESSENGMLITYKGKQYRYNENITNILCIGNDRSVNAIEIKESGGNQYATGGQADSLFLLTMDLETGENKVVNISRETMAEVNHYDKDDKLLSTNKEQICLAYAYGDGKETSCNHERDAVRKLFYNLPINSYLSLDIDGIQVINDYVGGVTVTSPETIAEFKQGETYTLMGSLAQSFVRSRSHEGFDGNSKRMERQKEYLNSFALNVMAKTRSDLTTPLNIYNTAKPYITTDIDLNKVTYFAVTALRGGMNELNMENVPGEVKEGKDFAEFYVNEKEFFELFLKLYYTEVR